MDALIVKGHKKGKVVNLEAENNHYKDEDDFLYTMNDFVPLDMIHHEEHKAEILAQYWTTVHDTIKKYLKNGEHHESYNVST